ncbi:MAG: hypothetical protein QG650_792, partial [Patescibacteria group bacterium]|nr:hypothetical protein [Patescibacteria group bacterium]
LIDGATIGSVPGCDADGDFSGYDVPAMESGESKPVLKTVTNGEVNGTAYCSFGALSVSSEAATCDSGYVPASGPSCVENVCGGSVPANAAASVGGTQAVGTDWHYSASADVCTFDCVSGYSWDSGSSSCKADCDGSASDTHAGFGPYALSSVPALVHGASASFSGTAAFPASPANGELTATFAYSCSDGTLTKDSSTNGSGSCASANYTWNGSWSAPACVIDSFPVSGSFGASASGAAVSGCAGKTATADSTGAFSFGNVDYGTDCSNVLAVRPGYSCSTATDGPISLASAFSGVSGSCSQNVQTLAGSLRFNGTNAYLSRTPTTASGQDKWTYSVWVKRSATG